MNNTPSAKSDPIKVGAEIQKTFGKLSASEVANYPGKLNEFYAAVEKTQGIKRPEAEKTVQKLEADCAAACSTGANKPANSDNAAPIAKVANS
jgi:hypothetical protein